MKKKQAFTLIELLVVIAIIALLMAILMPALRRVKKQSQATVCLVNLRQWGNIFAMYTDDNDGFFMAPWQAGTSWPNVLESYYKDKKFCLCPAATKLTSEGVTGSLPSARAWGAWPGMVQGHYINGVYGSYGINAWVHNQPKDAPDNLWGQPEVYKWKTMNVIKNTNNIPLFLDCMVPASAPDDTDYPPSFEGLWEPGSPSGMCNFCINRHDGYINGVFFDFSVRRIGLKELWHLKWHREYDTNGPWTKAGGVQPSDWSEWMRKFKDY